MATLLVHITHGPESPTRVALGFLVARTALDEGHEVSLFLAGDAAHIVPPTGAKGLNLAASDAAYLSRALAAYFNHTDNDGVAAYSATALARVWKSERFSWQLTMLMHRFPDSSPFDRQMQLAELDYIAGSSAAQTAIAENYGGLPL